MSGFKQLLKDKWITIPLALLVLHTLLALGAPILTPYSPEQMNFGSMLQAPTWDNWFGTDEYGRDVLTRVLYGGRLTLTFGIGAVALSLLFAIPVGLVSGYMGGRIDQLVMRSMDVLMSFPSLLLGLLILIVGGQNLFNLILAVGIVYFPRSARVVRSAVLSVKHSEFVHAARARGESMSYILVREILPCVWGPIIVEVCIRLGYAILLGASFNYLGLGVRPPAADWGSLINAAKPYMMLAPWTALFPALFIVTLVASFNLVGDGLNRHLEGAAVHE